MAVDQVRKLRGEERTLRLEALQFFVGYQSKVPNFVTSLNLIAFGPFWWACWILHLLIGSAIPMYILINRPSPLKGCLRISSCFKIFKVSG